MIAYKIIHEDNEYFSLTVREYIAMLYAEF